MEDELQEALAQVEALLEADPTNEEALQVYAELKEATSALSEAPSAVPVEAAEEEGSARDDGDPQVAIDEAMAVLDEDDRPCALPERTWDPQSMYTDRLTAAAAPGDVRSANNSRIHPRSAFANFKPDFKALAEHYEGLRLHMAKGGVLDFKDERATKELTRSLLHSDHGIDWWVPKGHLIPPLTNRLNYIHWLEDLMELSKPPGEAPVRGLDIGCGANNIYPLIGASACGWDFVGTDITPEAVLWARRNVSCNPGLRGNIQVRQVAEVREGSRAPSGMLANAVGSGEAFHFCMCNPPFFESMKEAGRNPNAACGGTPAEMVCKGGELAFLMSMVDESLELRGQVHWYTSMLGKKATLKAIRKHLHTLKVPVIRSTQFFQGETSRWAVAWSFAVDPRTATVPLQRVPAAAATQAASIVAAPPRRFVSFVIQVKPRTALQQVFKELKGLLLKEGVACSRVDEVMLKLTGTWSAVESSKRRKTGESVAAAATVCHSIIGFNSMVYEESPRKIKVAGTLDSPTVRAEDAEEATRAFNSLFSHVEEGLRGLFE